MKMNLWKSVCIAICAAGVFSGNAETGGEKEFPLLPASLRMPENSVTVIGPEGQFEVDGKPRYLMGVIFYEGTIRSIPYPAFGYPESLKWLYENLLDYEGTQRIGFDTVGMFTPTRWMSRYRKGHRVQEAPDQYRRPIDAGLPLYVDYTGAGWHHGGLNPKRDKTIPKEAFLRGHFMSYDMLHPVGRQFYLDMWRDGALVMKEHGAKPLWYELFNEPGPTVLSASGRAEFVRRMEKKYKNIEALNRVWGTEYTSFRQAGEFKRLADNPVLNIEWIKFTEDVFYELCREGIQTIREIDPRPEAGFCIQPVTMRTKGINLYRINTLMNRISSSTGGGNSVQAHFLRAMADGKPISDGEMYTGSTRSGFRNAYLTQFARGFNASFLFKWDKRSSDWVTKKKGPDGRTVFDVETSIAKAKKSAEKFPYNLLNPWAVPTESLLGIRDAKRDIADVSVLFAPRDRGIPRRTALLYSVPTDRVAEALGHSNRRLLEYYSLALEYAHIPQDMIFEEQLASGRQNRYGVLIAAGVDAVYEKTPEYLRKFAQDGGTLLLAQEVLDRGELSHIRKDNTFPAIRCGREILNAEAASFRWNGKEYTASLYKTTAPGAGWTPLAVIGKTPVLFERKEGKGRILFLNASMPVEALSAFLTDLLAERNIRPVCRVMDLASGKAAPDIEVNKAVREGMTGYLIANRGLGSRLVGFSPEEKAVFCRIDHRNADMPRRIVKGKDGLLPLLLLPGDVVILVGGSRAELERRFGKMPEESYEQTVKEGNAALEKEKAERAKDRVVFQVDPNRIRPIDLRAHVNRAFVDTVAGDGKGGWTDQGENSLHGTQWGIQNCAGVPMEFIRVDQNDYKTCIVLGSRKHPEAPLAVKGIRVGLHVKNLYFLHATAWSGGHSFSYVIHYADGSVLELPIRDEIEVADWFWAAKTRRSTMTAHTGWLNSEGRGLYIWRWENPHPEKMVRSFDIVSQNRNSIPIIVAVSAELPSGEDTESRPLSWKRNGGTVELSEPFLLPSGFESGTLLLEVKAEQKFHIAGDKTVTVDPSVYRAENGWIRVPLPLERLLNDPRSALRKLRLTPAEGVTVRSVSVLCRRTRAALDPRSGVMIPAAWNRMVRPRLAGDAVEFPISEKGTSWCGGFIRIIPPAAVNGGETGRLCLQFNTLADQWGKHQQLPGIQISLKGTDAGGKTVTTPYLPLKFLQKPDNEPATWQEAEVNLSRAAAWRNFRFVDQISFQYRMVPEKRSGAAIRNLRFSR